MNPVEKPTQKWSRKNPRKFFRGGEPVQSSPQQVTNS